MIIPLGSSGGDHIILTVLEVTSGNHSLTGGPGTIKRIKIKHHITFKQMEGSLTSTCQLLMENSHNRRAVVTYHHPVSVGLLVAD